MAFNRSFPALRLSAAALVLSLSLAACGETNDNAAVAEGESDMAGSDMAGTDMGGATGDLSVVKARQDNFEEIGDAFKAIRGQLENSTPDFAVIQSNAAIINTNAKKVSGYFPEGTGPASGADTEALPAIWEKPTEFNAATERLVSESENMLTAASSGDPAAVGAAAKQLGGACKNCHDQFREDDD